MRFVIADFRAGSISAREAAANLSANASALEGMPYVLTRELANLMMQLEDAAIVEEDGFQSNSREIAKRLAAEIEKVPTNV